MNTNDDIATELSREKCGSGQTKGLKMTMKQKKSVWVIILPLLFLGPVGIWGSMVVAVGISELVSWSDTIVAGTVKHVEAHWNPKRTSINTRITLVDLRFAKGNPDEVEQITLEFAGGSIHDTTVVVDGVPSFRVGERNILFLALHDTSASQYSPLVGLFQGKFVVQNKGERAETIIDSFGRELVDIQSDNLRVMVPEQVQVEEPVIRLENDGRLQIRQPDYSDQDAASSQSSPEPALIRARQRGPSVSGEESRSAPRQHRTVRIITGGYVLPVVLKSHEAPSVRLTEDRFLAWVESKGRR